MHFILSSQRNLTEILRNQHNFICSCTDAKFRPIGAVLLSGMVKLIGETKEDPRLRSLAYVAVGKIAKRVPNLVNKDIALLQTFFDAMCKVEIFDFLRMYFIDNSLILFVLHQGSVVLPNLSGGVRKQIGCAGGTFHDVYRFQEH